MLRCLRTLLLVLVAIAVVGGTTTQLARSMQPAAPMTMAGMPCGATMPGMGAGPAKPMTPCKGMTPDCIKQLGCVADVGLPARLATGQLAPSFDTVAYWSAWIKPAGVDCGPEPLPPRTT